MTSPGLDLAPAPAPAPALAILEDMQETGPEAGTPRFSSLKSFISLETLRAVHKLGFKRLSPVQAEAMPALLRGSDVAATARTGSGKTLAFLIPAIETVRRRLGTAHVEGTTCIIISPTRELAMQTHGVLQDLIVFQDSISSALVIGGENRKMQAAELAQGIDIIVATPGRLLDHMRSKEFIFKRVECLVLDEADKMLQYGFEEDLKQIIKLLPKKRQTMLFSATQSEKTASLMELAMNESLEFVNVDKDKEMATVDGLKHGYVICKTEDRLWWLFKVLKKTRKQKVMVFFSSCKSVEFHHTFFRHHCNAPVMCIHGKMNQCDRTASMTEFYNAEKGTLFCTDVAARGLDIPAVDWIIQYDPPGDTSEYIHRVGRTARGVDASGNAVLLLRPEEQGFLQYLQEAKLHLDLYKMWDDFDNLQLMLEKAVIEDANFRQLAIEAYEGYIRAFEVRRLKTVFNLITLDLDSVARSFGLEKKPELDIRVGFKKKHRQRKRIAATSVAENGVSNSKTARL